MEAEITEQPLDRLRRNRNAMYALQPDLRAIGAEAVLKARLLDQRDEFWRDATPAPSRVPGQQTWNSVGTVAIAPRADGHAAQGEMARCRLDAMVLDITQHLQPVLHTRTVLRRNRHVGHRCSPSKKNACR